MLIWQTLCFLLVDIVSVVVVVVVAVVDHVYFAEQILTEAAWNYLEQNWTERKKKNTTNDSIEQKNV